MEKNMSMIDRGLRNIFAVIVAGLYYFKFISGNFAVVMALIAFYLTLTSMVAFCPIYYLLKINSIKK